jgi:hypothetical protein
VQAPLQGLAHLVLVDNPASRAWRLPPDGEQVLMAMTRRDADLQRHFGAAPGVVRRLPGGRLQAGTAAAPGHGGGQGSGEHYRGTGWMSARSNAWPRSERLIGERA